MTQQQLQNRYVTEVSLELNNLFMSWDDKLREWHKWSTIALGYHSPISFGWPPGRFADLIETNVKGINMSVVGALLLVVERTTKNEFDVGLVDYGGIQSLNNEIMVRWQKETEKTREMVAKRLQILNVPVDKNMVMKAMRGGIA